MSHVTCCDVPTEDNASIDFVTNAALQIVYRKWTDLVVAVSWLGLASHTVVGQISYSGRTDLILGPEQFDR